MAKKICINCGYYGRPRKTSSFLTELAVWILFGFLAVAFIWLIIIPIFYTLYRFIAGTKFICPSCKAQDTMVSTDSPIGRDLYNKYYKNTENKNIFQ